MKLLPLSVVLFTGVAFSLLAAQPAPVKTNIPYSDAKHSFIHYFYPQQTIQPFAVIDSLIRLGLSASTELQVTAFDLSPKVSQHLEAARELPASPIRSVGSTNVVYMALKGIGEAGDRIVWYQKPQGKGQRANA